MLQELERTGESQISLTDPDSRAMALNPKVGVGYNAQVAVDSKHKLIVEQEVTNAGTDLGLLAPTATAAKEALEADKIKAVTDSGYYKGEDIAACEAAGIEAYVPRPQRGFAVREGLFRKEEFHYDAQNDVLTQPEEREFAATSILRCHVKLIPSWDGRPTAGECETNNRANACGSTSWLVSIFELIRRLGGLRRGVFC